MITVIEREGSNEIFFNFHGIPTLYRARVIGKGEGFTRVKVLDSSNGEGSFREWGEDSDGAINLSEPDIKRFTVSEDIKEK